ncbi:MAG: hypothetical protein ACRDQ5_00500 [Sciscionella sp.]
MRMHEQQWFEVGGVRHATRQRGAVAGQVVGTLCLIQVVVEVPALDDPAPGDVPPRCVECERARLDLVPLGVRV